MFYVRFMCVLNRNNDNPEVIIIIAMNHYLFLIFREKKRQTFELSFLNNAHSLFLSC